MQTKKTLKELSLLDRFLFSEVMKEPETMRTVLEIILGKEVVLKYLPQPEREEKRSPLSRYIKMDVWAQDDEGNVYDTEVQKKNTNNLPRRSRYYQGMIDGKLLPPGEVDFNALKDTYIIMIMPFDIFGEGKYMYTFRMKCEEAPGISLQDGAVRIFLNTKGKNKEEIRSELIEFLEFMESSRDEEFLCHSEAVRQIQRRVTEVKASEEVGVRYMQEWEERELERQEARREGMEAGKEQGESLVTHLLQKLLENGRTEDLEKAVKDKGFRKQLYEEYHLK